MLRPILHLSSMLLAAAMVTSTAGRAESSTQARDTAQAQDASGTPQQMYERYLDFPSLVRGGTVAPRWLANDRFWFVDEARGGTAYLVDPAVGGQPEVVLDLDALRTAMVDVFGQQSAASVALPPADLTLLRDGETAAFSLAGQAFRWHRSEKRLEAVPTSSDHANERLRGRIVRPARFPGFPPIRELLSPDRRYFLTEIGHDLGLRATADGRAEQLTTGGTAERPWRVQQDELWNRSVWSPDGTRVAVVREDRRGVPREPLVHWLKTHPEVTWLPYTKAGEQLTRTELYVIDVFGKKPVRLELGDESNRYFHLAGFSPDSRFLWLLDARRDFKSVSLLRAEVRTGAVETVLVERQKTFVKNLGIHPEWIELFTPLPERQQFLWLSERDGWDHLYLYDAKGRLIRRLTEGAFPLLHVVGVDEAGGWVYVTAHAEPRVYDTHLYRVSLEGGPLERLTEAPGRHSAVLSPSKRFFVDRHSSLDRPPRSELRTTDGTLVATVAEADVSGLHDLQWQPPEAFTAKAADGKTDLHGVLYKPWNFDPRKRYPVIEHIYAGPFMAYVPWTFTASGWRGSYAQALAQLGFVTFLVDGRGTPERGKAFQDAIYRRFGQIEIDDHTAVLEQLAAQRPYMDTHRVGIFGGSWGGYMTVRALLTAPDVYHVGIATNPVYDFFDHGAEGLEAYLGGLPQDDPAPYLAGSNLVLADRLQGKLLMIHATSDVNATLSTTMKMIDALVRAGKPYDLILLPEQDHHPKGDAQRYRLDAHRRHFLEHLQGVREVMP